MRRVVHLLPVELRAPERFRILRVRYGIRIPPEGLELALPALAYSSAQLLVRMVREVEERCRRAPLLTLEEHRDERRRENERGRNLQQLRRDDRAQTVARGAIPDLVVVLDIGEEPLARDPYGLPPVHPVAVGGVTAAVNESVLQRDREVLDVSEVRVVTVGLTGHDGVQSVVEVIAPLRIHAVPTGLAALDHPGVVEVALRDHEQVPPQMVRELLHVYRDLFEDVQSGAVEDRVHSIETQPVTVVIVQPHQRVLDEEGADRSAPRPVEVDRLAPRGRVPVREVGAVLAEVVPSRAEVVVDDVHDHREPMAVAGVDQPLEPMGTSIRVVRREQVDAVVAPAVVARELRHRKQLDRCDAEVYEVGEPFDSRIKGALFGERPDVELVDDGASDGRAFPGGVAPLELGMVDQARQRMRPVRLPGRAGVRQWIAAVEREPVVVARSRFCFEREPASTVGRHRQSVAVQDQFDTLRVRSPNLERLKRFQMRPPPHARAARPGIFPTGPRARPCPRTAHP